MRLPILAFALGVIACNRGASTAAPAPGATPNAAPAPRAPERIQAPTWPKPPLASAPWDIPKSDLPPAIGDAARVLFSQGLADPRGCSYREIEVERGDVWTGGGEITKAHGFVLPSHGADVYAVGWNGGLYRVVRSGEAADPKADVLAALARTNDETPRRVSSEEISLSPVASPMTAVLLLRLGEGELASRVWSAQKQLAPAPAKDPGAAYVALATMWLSMLYERAVTAHMRGSDGIALEMVRQLTLARPLVEQEARRRVGGKTDEDEPRIPFLAELPIFAADQERRALGLRAPSGDRVSVLVKKLEDVAARQSGQPGAVDLASDPIVAELIAIGPPAVPALIAVIESDERLTRSVHFWRDFAYERTILGVHEAAYAVIAAIVDVSFFEPVSTGDNLTSRGSAGRRKLAAALRKYWEKWKDTPVVEQWFGRLADDTAKSEQWLEVARRIVQVSKDDHPTSMLFAHAPTVSASSATMRGESLRAKSSPSVGDLFERRIAAMKLEQACEMSSLFAEWDGDRAKPVLVRKAEEAIAASLETPGHLGNADCIAVLTSYRVAAADSNALVDYAAWLEGTTPAGTFLTETVFAPMVRSPNDPAIVRASTKLFAPTSPWVPFVRLYGESWQAEFFPMPELHSLVRGDMMKVDAYRLHVLAALADKRRVADGLVDGRKIRISSSDRMAVITTVDPPAPLPPSGTRFVVRVADAYASAIARRSGAPAYAEYWPEKERAAALRRMTAYVSSLR